MINLLTFLIILIMGTQFGIAFASSVIVHPLLTEVKRPTAIEVFKPFFHKTHTTVLSMSIIVSVLALILSIVSRNWWWFGISLLMHLNGPYTLKFMMPTNRRCRLPLSRYRFIVEILMVNFMLSWRYSPQVLMWS